MNICEFLERFPDDRSCLEHIVTARLGAPPLCPTCRSGYVKRSRDLKRYDCNKCSRQYRPTAGTLLHHSRLPVRMWFYAILLCVSGRHGASAHFLERQLGISYKAAWRMCDAIRRHLHGLDLIDRRPFVRPGSIVYVDETLVTGLIANSGSGSLNRIVFGISDGVRTWAEAIPDRSHRTILPLINRWIGPEVTVVTDSYSTYRRLGSLGYDHRTVKHCKGIWKNSEGLTTAPIEVFWSSFKRFLRQTPVRIMDKNLNHYLGEFLFRYNRRHYSAPPIDDALARFPDITF